MEQLFNVAAQFPTAIYSTLLGIIVIYWLIGLLGLIDLDFSGDSDLDLDSDTDISLDGFTGLLLTFGLTGIPFTLVISIIVLICWLISFYTQLYLLSWLPSGWLYYLVGALSSLAIFFISLPLTGLLIKPLKGMFSRVETANSNTLLGKDATIATGTVSESFGQARLFNEGAELLLDVRCSSEHTLKKGDRVLLIEYLKETHTYTVAPW